MSVPQSAALRLARATGDPLTEDDVDRLLETCGVRLVPLPRSFPVDEFRCADLVGIRADLPTSRRIWLKLHALGHVVLHRGDQVLDPVDVCRQERQAEIFAGFLAGVATVPGLPWEIADALGLPADCVDRWIHLVTG